MSYCKSCAAGGQCTSNEGCVARFGLVRHTEKQEPVAWMRDDEMKAMVSDEKRAWILCGQLELIKDYNKPLYTSPQVAEPQPQRQWVGLTDLDLQEIIGTSVTMGEFIKNTEAKLKENNK